MSEVFSERVSTDRRTYFFDVKETRERSFYLVIGELTQIGSDTERHRVMVFEENIELFLTGLAKAVEYMRRTTEREGPLENNSHQQDDRSNAVHDASMENALDVLNRIERTLNEIRKHFK